MPFDPNKHMTKLKGKDYLEVKWRLVWFRDECPNHGVYTEILHFDDKRATVKATITDLDGRVLATGHKTETPAGFSDYLEKAETGAIGRALAALGYGTQFAPELEESPDRPADSPVERPTQRQQRQQPQPKQTDKEHPNKNRITEALCKSIYERGTWLGWSDQQVRGFAGDLFQREVTSLYDLDKEQLQQVLQEIHKQTAAVS